MFFVIITNVITVFTVITNGCFVPWSSSVASANPSAEKRSSWPRSSSARPIPTRAPGSIIIIFSSYHDDDGDVGGGRRTTTRPQFRSRHRCFSFLLRCVTEPCCCCSCSDWLHSLLAVRGTFTGSPTPTCPLQRLSTRGHVNDGPPTKRLCPRSDRQYVSLTTV